MLLNLITENTTLKILIAAVSIGIIYAIATGEAGKGGKA